MTRQGHIPKMVIKKFGKFWRLETQTDARLIFVPVEQKAGYGRKHDGGSFFKSWRKRMHRPKPNGTFAKPKGGDEKKEQWTQERAAKFFGVTQSFIAKVETGEKEMTKAMMQVVFGRTEQERGQDKHELKEVVASIKSRPPKKQPKHW
jgi:hypothetical protein